MSEEISTPEPNEPSPSRRSNGWKRLSSEAALILLATMVVYLGAYTYEMAYLSYFRIPWDFVEASPALLSVVGMAFLFLVMIFVRSLFFLRDVALVTEQGKWVPFGIFMLMILGWVAERSRGEGITVGGGLALIIAVLVGGILLWVLPEYLTARLRKVIKHRSVAKTFDVSESLERRIAKDKTLPAEILNCVLVIVAVWTVCNILGSHHAKIRSEHYTYEEDLILIRRYGDHMICKPVNREARTFDSRFAVIPLTDKWSTFKLEKIGRLTYAPDPQ